MREIVLVVHNVRSSHNVGAMLRTAEGLGVSKVYLSGYTPYPAAKDDRRLPHLAKKIHSRIAKTALGAESLVDIENIDYAHKLFAELGGRGYAICILEQSGGSKKLPGFKAPAKVALLVGSEVSGVEQELIKKADFVLEIPMFGQKESFNVASAAAMALFYLRFM